MTNKQILIDDVDVSECEHLTETRHCKAQMSIMGTDTNKCKCFPNCYYKQLAREKQEYEELRQYHNKCCEDNAKEVATWIEKYNQSLRDLYNGKYCNTEKCQTLAHLKGDNDRLRKRIITIFACLIKANKASIIGATLWVDKITTLWDYIAQTLGIDGDQTQIEEQVEKLYSKGE